MRYLVVAAFTLFALTGCAGNNPEVPDCSDVWVEGNTLPKGYDGCERPDRSVGASAYECEDGKGELASYADRFVARPGGRIYSKDEAAYTAELESCQPGVTER
jgi:hypothetical protein